MNSVTVLFLSFVAWFFCSWNWFGPETRVNKKLNARSSLHERVQKSCELCYCNWISISVLRKIYTVLKAENPSQKESETTRIPTLIEVSLCWFVQHFIRAWSRKKRRKVTLQKVYKISSLAAIAAATAFVDHWRDFPLAFEISFVVVAIQSDEKNCLCSCFFSHSISLISFSAISMSAYNHLRCHTTVFWKTMFLCATFGFFILVGWLWIVIRHQ